MSLLDQVRKLEQQVVDRLKELEPLTREYDQLRKLAERLGITYSPRPADSDAKPSTTSSRGRSRASARQRTGRSAAKATTARPSTRASGKAAGKPRTTRSATRKRAPTSAQSAGASATAAPTRRPKRAGSSGKGTGSRRATAARPGRRQDDVLRLIDENPGITVREIGERLGVDATGLYRVVKRLTEDGRVRKDGTRLLPVEPAATPASETVTASAPETPPGGGAETPEANASANPESPTAADSAPARDT